MIEILSGLSLFSVILTLIAFEIGLWVQKKLPYALCNPLLIAVVLVIGFLLLFRIPADTYLTGCKSFSWLLTPATVCLAVPMYEQVQNLKKSLPAIIIGVAAGAATSLACVAGMSMLFGLDWTLEASLLPKSITTAMGIALSEQMGGVVAITTTSIVVTGMLGSIFGSFLCKILKITNPIAQGVAFGTASHVIGTNRANQISELTGAVSSLSLVIAGICTAVLCPLFFG